MAAQGLHLYPASEPSAPPYPPVQYQQGPYPLPPHQYGAPPPISFGSVAWKGPYSAHPSYVVYHGMSPLVSHQTGVSTQPQAQWMQAPTPIPNCPPGLEYLTLMEVQVPPGKAIGYIVQEWHPFVPKVNILNETVLKIRGSCLAMSCSGDVNFEVVSRDEATVVGKISKQWSGLVREYLTDTDNFGIQFPMDLDVKIEAVLLGTIISLDFMYYQQNPGARPGRIRQM